MPWLQYHFPHSTEYVIATRALILLFSLRTQVLKRELAQATFYLSDIRLLIAYDYQDSLGMMWQGSHRILIYSTGPFAIFLLSPLGPPPFFFKEKKCYS